jgi:Tfp pilus assembly protein PilV
MTIKQFKKFTLHLSGFTLIEVLIASVLLFSSLALVSLLYKGALIASEKSTQHLVLAGVVPTILENIRFSIRAKGTTPAIELSGQDSVWGVNYSWQAKQIDIKPPILIFNPPTQITNKYKFWEVNMVVKFGAIDRTYGFKEVSWNET